ncbi:YrbL family protein [Photobacterium sp. SDRW27]|uniref:YrbL family protein n=1 Tax=Photobacterium obscurum TaxID=2829490 RepID=UPI00224403DC|nr:YrbL family protein [Photobacterium obscurum]MCW8329579.1 YrbL family protein [Photobacterium obscurum]
MLALTDDLLIGKGTERECYRHPTATNQCIKIRWNKQRKANESVREYLYFKYFCKSRLLDIPIAKPLNWVETNRGKGLIYELITDYDQQISRSLKYMLENDLITRDLAAEKLVQLREQLIHHNIAVTDVTKQNVACQFITPTEFRLVLIDGYGFSNFLPVALFSQRLSRKQIERRVNRCFKYL